MTGVQTCALPILNPAGLGFYRTGEFVFTPGLNFSNNKNLYREATTKEKKNAFGLGPIGWVIGNSLRNSPKAAQAFSIVFMQNANYNNYTHYKGLNNYSSFTEMWAEEVAKSGKTIDEIIRDPQYSLSSALGLYTYLVDTFRINNALQVKEIGRAHV